MVNSFLKGKRSVESRESSDPPMRRTFEDDNDDDAPTPTLIGGVTKEADEGPAEVIIPEEFNCEG